MTDWLDELAAWWSALPTEWMFLLVLPLLVGAVGLLVDRGTQEREPRRAAAPARRRPHRQPREQ
ncbi:MAG TPA: hypothetical protein VFM98_15025 [Ramlibacter sp.]|uniref:hypothetical protein n=1 Tax=Ramlibacter sp. TaxID=1917967 RepID=UPI002D802F09|nr:hypothetical protein [Ramlibacter sp.]HET8746917.1 hypothetical protein [Ramlibacter sp.]